MMKLVVLVAVVALVLWLMRSRAPGLRGGGPKPGPAPRIEGMVECAHCGLNLPRSEAVLEGDQAYCSAAHREAGPRRP